ncbi:MAG: two pore domain potassium channel family protein [Nitrospira sp.]|nr:two pore domain potassium channel family protein [Nitrospira sp.]
MSVFVHYEAVYRISTFINLRANRPRLGVIAGIVLALLAHIVEIVIFASGYYGLILAGEYGAIVSEFTPGFSDCVYYSFVTYTTLGLGDLIPTGPLRFLTGIESLTGLVLIAWTASCIYLQMETLYRKNSTSA